MSTRIAVALALALLFAAASPCLADENEVEEQPLGLEDAELRDVEDLFERSWIGFGYEWLAFPRFEFKMAFGGAASEGPATLLQAHDDLGLNRHPELGPQAVRLELDFPNASAHIRLMAPARFQGRRHILERDIVFGGRSFAAGTEVTSSLTMLDGSLSLQYHIANSRYLRFSPLMRLRTFGLRAELRGVSGPSATQRSDNRDIAGALPLGKLRMWLWPEFGVGFNFGVRDYAEVGFEVSTVVLEFFELRGRGLLAELNFTAYPLLNIGIRLGVEVQDFSIESRSNSLRTSSELRTQFGAVSLQFIFRF